MNKSPHELSVTTERKTIELCADELRKGVRCILTCGHLGDHECQAVDVSDPIRWKQRASCEQAR